MVSRAEAFCPGHITAFFEVCKAKDSRHWGSRGAGLCMTLGVRTEVKVRAASNQRVRIFLNGEEEKAETTSRVIEKLIGDRKIEVYILSEIQLPVSQGFGMSGAGALSTAIALNKAAKLELSRDEIVGIAHEAEVESGTGLGDVYPQSLGGMDLRLEPGGPPYGNIKKFDVEAPLLLCIIGSPILTRDVLHNSHMVKIINMEGHRHVEEFKKEPSLNNLFLLGQDFATKTKLADLRLNEAISMCAPYGKAAMSMLGNSIFCTGNIEVLGSILSNYGPRFMCKVDSQGVRLL